MEKLAPLASAFPGWKDRVRTVKVFEIAAQMYVARCALTDLSGGPDREALQKQCIDEAIQFVDRFDKTARGEVDG